jgi:cytochrome c biogenesis protein CcdA/thiol-disulfide isomerase/thioredoxin
VDPEDWSLMVTLLAVGFVAGLVTAISPCILPVLPVVFAGGTTGGWRRSVAIVVGLATSFAVATLFGIALLNALGLPLDFLNDLGIALLLLLAVGLVIDPIGALLERPFARLQTAPRVGAGTRSGLVLGAGLGLVFVPCAGPILAAIATAAARERFSTQAVLLTVAYALGAALPLLVLALLSQRLATTWSLVRTHARTVRRVSGVLIGTMAVVILTGAVMGLQTDVPAFASSIENHLITGSVASQLDTIKGEKANPFATKQGQHPSASLADLGAAPNFTGITAWLNTPGDRPLTLRELRGKVVLVDFWTYSCINCRRSLPHVEAWYRAYARDGLVVVGVHTPEFAFEHVVSNVAAAANGLGVTYPIAVDNNYGTWDAYNNEYWPAEYLIDQNGEVRHTSFGEGDYTLMEADIRALLTAGGATHLPAWTETPNRTPTGELTPETYLGYELQYEHDDENVDTELVPNVSVDYTLPNPLPSDLVAYGGYWDAHAEESTAGANATLEVSFTGQDVYLVLGGTGTVRVSLDGAPPSVVHVSGFPDLYTLYAGSSSTYGTLLLHVSPGVRAYDFTFG